MYQCGICDDLDFTTKGKCLGHLREQHAGIQFKCNMCRKLFRRNDNPHICRARREDYAPFVMATGEKGEAAAAVLNKFMDWAEREKCHEVKVLLSEEAYKEKFGNCVGRGRPISRPPVGQFENCGGRGRTITRLPAGQFIDPTQRKRTQPLLPYNGKCRRLSESSRSSSSSSRTSVSTASSSSSSSSSSSAVSSLSSASKHSFALQRFCKTPVLSEAEEALTEIGDKSVRLNSYLEETGCEEPFVSDEEDERRVNVESRENEIGESQKGERGGARD